MLDELNTLSTVDTVLKKLDEVNTLYLQKVGEQIKTIGEMNTTSLDRLSVMTEMGANITEITRQLAAAMEVTERDVMKIYQKALTDVYDSPRFRKALEYKSLTPADFRRINTFAEAVSRQTMGRLENFSNTTAISQDYRAAVDKCVLAVSSGLTSYSEATRGVIREVGSGGVKVIYESRYRRRLDSAVRQNVIDGANQISGHCADMIGEALGYDAVELTAHLNSAPDHEPVQGRVFLRSEFDKMQTERDFQDVDGHRYKGFRRPINQWNCGHFAMPFSTEFSKRVYSDEDLARFIRQNHDKVEIDGKKYTKYECSQIMRRLETETRRQKDIAVVAKAAGNEDERRLRQAKINALSAKYKQVAQAAGPRERRGRMVVQGFRAVQAETKGTTSKADTTPNAMSKQGEEPLLDTAKPTIHSVEEYKSLKEYASSKGIRIHEVHTFDGDSEVLKEQIDAIAEIRREYGITKKSTITFRNMDAGDLAQTNPEGTVISFSKAALRNREITNTYLNEDDTLAASNVKGIAYHEMGHVISKQYGEKGLEIARKAYYNIFKESPDTISLLQYLESNVSSYSVFLPEEKNGKRFQAKYYKEITPELVSKDKTNPTKFSNEFVRLLKEAYGL